VPVPHDTCPDCGGPLAEERVDVASITELPAMPQPQVTRYRVWVCRCTVCGAQVRGQHPDVAPAPYGATAHRLGPRVMAAAHALHHGVGIPVRKVPLVMAALTGVRLTQGALTQDALRRAAGVVGTAYEHLRATVPETPVVYTDDTGRRVGGELAHLMAFETEAATVYQIRPRHRHSVADFKVEAEALQTELTYQLRNRRLKDRDNQRLLNELGWHHDRGHVLRFLVDPRIEPTNHRAGTGLAPGRHRPSGVARLQKRRWCARLCRLHQCRAHAGQTRRRFAGGEPVPTVLRPGRSRDFSLIFPQTSTR
jgi:hypothetical protein